MGCGRLRQIQGAQDAFVRPLEPQPLERTTPKGGNGDITSVGAVGFAEFDPLALPGKAAVAAIEGDRRKVILQMQGAFQAAVLADHGRI